MRKSLCEINLSTHVCQPRTSATCFIQGSSTRLRHGANAEPPHVRLPPEHDPKTWNPLVDGQTDPDNPVWKTFLNTKMLPKGPFYIGTVVHTSNSKTAKVHVPYYRDGGKYGKYRRVRRTIKFMTHDEEERCDAGDIVEIRHSRPHSKRKHTEVTRILVKNPSQVFLDQNPEYKITRDAKALEALKQKQVKDELLGIGVSEEASSESNL